MRKNAKRLFSAFLVLCLVMGFITSGVPRALAETDHDETKNTTELIGDARSDDEFPLAIGEIDSIESSDATFTISLDENAPVVSGEEITMTTDTENDEENDGGFFSAIGDVFGGIADFLFPTKTAHAATNTLKVTFSGYVSYCNHRMGYKYVVTDKEEYKNRLVYCLDIGKTSTDGTIEAGKNVSAKITYCLVNGAQKKGGKCVNSKYSSGSAEADYFITSAAIGQTGELDGCTGHTKSIKYTISPKSTEWLEVGNGLYRSKDKFVRTKEGPVIDVSYTITGAPSGLTTGEINKSSSDISDEDDLKKYDICVAQTDKDKTSANFYLYAKQEAYEQIIAEQKTIKVKAEASANEKGGRAWKPTVISQQRITLLEEFITPKSASASAKVTPENPKRGSLTLKKISKGSVSPVNGATYYLYEDPECEDLFCEMHSDGNGIYATDIEDLTQDTYYLKEIMNPDGYELDDQVYPIDISYFRIVDATGTVIQEGQEYTHEETESPVNVMLTKTDAISAATVKNARFAIYNDRACTERTPIDPSKPELGLVPELTYDEDLDGYVSAQFYKSQDVYFIKETVPEGYVDTGEVYEVSVERGELSTADNITNTPIMCELSAVKEDAETKTAQGDATLVGATYGLYAAHDIMHPDGSGYMKGTEITVTTGTDSTLFDVEAKGKHIGRNQAGFHGR